MRCVPCANHIPALITILGTKYTEHEMFKPGSLQVILDYKILNEKVISDKRFRAFHVHAFSISNELGAQISFLVSHKVVIVVSESASGVSSVYPYRRIIFRK